MEVILKKDVDILGGFGDTLKVASGYARNYLIPKGLAVAATPGNIRQFHAEKDAYLKKEEQKLAAAEKLASSVDGVALSFARKTADEEEKIFGSVTSADIEKGLKAKGFAEIDKKHIFIPEPIKKLGTHDVEIRLHGGVKANITLEVVKQ